MAQHQVYWTVSPPTPLTVDNKVVPPTVITVNGNPDDPTNDKPIVVLLHGTSGTIADMSNPAVHPTFNWNHQSPLDPGEVDRGWTWYPPILPYWSIGLDDTKEVTSWETFLNGQGYPTVNYAQVLNQGALDIPVQELDAVVKFIISTWPERKIAFVTHSRGGILFRKWLVGHGLEQEVQKRLTTVAMLHSPNQGTNIATIANRVAEGVRVIRDVSPVLDGLANWLDDQVDHPAYHTYAMGSQELADIARAEGAQGVPAIDYHTYGGNSPMLTRIVAKPFTLGSYLPGVGQDANGDWHVGFHWFTSTTTFPPNTIPDGIVVPLQIEGMPVPPEIVEGGGDILVTADSAKLPFSVHSVNPLNHAEALWDPTLQQQVAALLRRFTGRLPTKGELVVSATYTTAANRVPSPLPPPLDVPVVLHFRVTDSHTGAPVAANISVTVGTQTFTGSSDIGPCTFDSTQIYWSTRRDQSNAGEGMRICAFHIPSHYPVATVSAQGYASVHVRLGPDATDVKVAPPLCLVIPASIPVGMASALQLYLAIHGGDPIPEESPVAGLDHAAWQRLRPEVTAWHTAVKASAISLPGRTVGAHSILSAKNTAGAGVLRRP